MSSEGLVFAKITGVIFCDSGQSSKADLTRGCKVQSGFKQRGTRSADSLVRANLI